MTEKYTEWTRFRKRIFIDRNAKDIYEAWAMPGKISEWFLEKASYRDPSGNIRDDYETVQEGDSFRWKWNNWDFEEEGKILSADGHSRISFTFGTGGKVYIELVDHKDRTEVILRQEEIPSDEKSKREIFVGCITAWTFWLANLKAWLEYDITLHARGLRQEDTTDLANS